MDKNKLEPTHRYTSRWCCRPARNSVTLIILCTLLAFCIGRSKPFTTLGDESRCHNHQQKQWNFHCHVVVCVHNRLKPLTASTHRCSRSNCVAATVEPTTNNPRCLLNNPSTLEHSSASPSIPSLTLLLRIESLSVD